MIPKYVGNLAKVRLLMPISAYIPTYFGKISY